MSTDRYTVKRKGLALVLVPTFLAVVIATGLLLRQHGPGNMGEGFLQGAALGLVVAGVGLWRAIRHPDRATTFERAWAQTGDERDDDVLTRALAVLGLLSFPLTGVAAIAIGLGAAAEMMLTLLLLAEVLVGAVAFAIVDRRS